MARLTRIAVLPLDDRPVTFDVPAKLGRMVGLEVLLPERDWLGTPWRIGDPEKLAHWLESVATRVDGIIVAVDAMLHGGLVPSRRGSVPAEDLETRLDTLRRLRSRTSADIAAFSVIQRMNRGDSPDEEAAYWRSHGASLYRLSMLEHRTKLGVASAAERGELDALRRAVPPAVVRDFLAIRRRNHAINRSMIALLDDGLLDYLVLAQDDTADFGWNVAEANRLRDELGRRGLHSRASVFAGCDEVASLLLARYAAGMRGFQFRVWPTFTTAKGPDITTSYEDRPLGALLDAHLAVLGGRTVEAPEDADLALYVHTPREAQACGEYQWLLSQPEDAAGLPRPARDMRNALASGAEGQCTMAELLAPDRDPASLVRSMEAMAADKPVALADVAYSNGADLALGDAIAASPLAARLAAYGAWNTAGNTLGTVLAHALVRVLAVRQGVSGMAERTHLDFLFSRLLDDYAFQARDRAATMYVDLDALGWSPTFQRLPPELVQPVVDRLEARLRASALALVEPFIDAGKAAGVRVANVALPWGRLFEIAFDVELLPVPNAGAAAKEAP